MYRLLAKADTKDNNTYYLHTVLDDKEEEVLYGVDNLEDAKIEAKNVLGGIGYKELKIISDGYDLIDTTVDYNQALNKPSINGIVLVGNKTYQELGIQPAGTYITDTELNEYDNTIKDYINNMNIDANKVLFDDGENFQDKYNNGELKGQIGEPGPAGQNGTNGVDGYTPQKGIDYFTEADKQELVQDVLNALPNAEEVSF